MIKLIPIVKESLIVTEIEENKPEEPTKVTERGFYYLQGQIEKLNEKARRYQVPPLNLVTVKEEMIKVLRPDLRDMEFSPGSFPDKNSPDWEQFFVLQKIYHVKIEGEPPHVEGYEFIAKIEHTEAGNLINFAPKASVQNLPSEFRNATQQCDLCHTARDRNNTFILRMDKDSDERFPGKKKNDLLMVGSTCLKRFLPPGGVNALLEYASIIDQIRRDLGAAEDMEPEDNHERGYGGGGWAHVSADSLMFFIIATHLTSGKYISKKKAEEFQTTSTLDDAISSMWPPRGSDPSKDKVLVKLKDDTFKEQVKKELESFDKWKKEKDWDAASVKEPNFANFFGNCKVLSNLDLISHSNFAKFGALYGVYLRDKGELEKMAALKASHKDDTYLGQPEQKVRMKVKVTKISQFEGDYGPQSRIAMVGEIKEKDPQTNQEIVKKGNVVYWTKPGFPLDQDEEGEIECTIKKHEPNRFTQLPETVITRAKVVNYITNPDRNAGNEKIKNWKGAVKIYNISHQRRWDYTTYPAKEIPDWTVTMYVDTNKHPDMTQVGSTFGVMMYYKPKDESEAQNFEQYRGKIVEIESVFSRQMTLDKLKTSGAELKSVKVLQVLGDINPSQT